MFAVTKIQIFESNSQLAKELGSVSYGCSPSQRYKFLKAIHNIKIIVIFRVQDVRRHKDTNFWKQFTTKPYNRIYDLLMFAVTKIQIFESNSQLFKPANVQGKDVRRHKDTNFWKQFTTTPVYSKIRVLMFAVTKIQIFESNSQRPEYRVLQIQRCSPSQRYKFLKAIHNIDLKINADRSDVRRHKDTNFWKQFTTVFNFRYIES